MFAFESDLAVLSVSEGYNLRNLEVGINAQLRMFSVSLILVHFDDKFENVVGSTV